MTPERAKALAASLDVGLGSPGVCCACLRQDGAVARRLRCPVVGGEWSAPTHLSWVAGVDPVEPHTEVADHVRLYDDGDGRAGRSRAVDPAGGGARGRVAGGADACL